MKTSKAKAISKPKKTSKSLEAVKNKKVTTSKSQLSEEEIREKAMEIYNQRIEREEYGTAEDDWLEAEKQLKGAIED
jgi:hypothetical protein